MPHFRKKNSDKEMNSFMTASQTKAVTVGEISNNILKARCSGWDIYTGIFHIPEKSQQDLSWIYLHINK